MSLVKPHPFSVETGGVTFSGTIVPLEFGDMLKINSVPTESGKPGFSASMELFAELLPKYLTGYSATDGTPIEDLTKYAVYMRVVSAFGTALLATARPENPNVPALPSAGLQRAKESQADTNLMGEKAG